MGKFTNFAVGGGAGLATGGPAGAVFGALGGLFGSDNKVGINYRDLTKGEQNILRQIEKSMPGLLASLDPKQIQALAAKFTADFTEQGLRQVGEVFGKSRERLRLDQVRTGGVLGSVAAEQKGRLGREESIARSSTISNAGLAGQSVAQQILAGNQATVGTYQGVANSIYGNQKQTGRTELGSLFNDLASLGLGASAHPESWINTKGSKPLGNVWEPGKNAIGGLFNVGGI